MYVAKYKAMKRSHVIPAGVVELKINEDIILGLFKDCLKNIVYGA